MQDVVLKKKKLSVSYNNGDVTVKRLDTGEEIYTTRLFWFAWKAFRSDTELYFYGIKN